MFVFINIELENALWNIENWCRVVAYRRTDGHEETKSAFHNFV